MAGYRLIPAVLCTILLICFGCTPAEKEKPPPAGVMVRVDAANWPVFGDDLDIGSLQKALNASRTYLRRLPPDRVFGYGPDTYTTAHLLRSLDAFEKYIRLFGGGEALRKALLGDFVLYRSVGSDGKGRVVFTGYYEPSLRGSLLPDDRFRWPVYSLPDDIIEADLGAFSKDLAGKKIKGRISGNTLLPYWSRAQIDQENALRDRDLELAWVDDPVDLFFLHIQGSGRVVLPDASEIRLGYAGANGRPYSSIGKYLIDRGYVERDNMSMQAIKSWLRSHPGRMDEVLGINESYVFFRLLEGDVVGNINVPLTPGRSVALDHRIFPKGALAWISGRKPVVKGEDLSGWSDFSRFVLVQDTGGAIQGPGRLDIFFGHGVEAESAAGRLKEPGTLYFLVLKPVS